MEIDRSKKEIFKSFSKEKKLYLYGNLSILTGISNFIIFMVIFPIWFTFFSDLGLGVDGKPIYLIAFLSCTAIISTGFYLRNKYKNHEEKT